MKQGLTHHAKKRMQKRGISSSRLSVFGGKYLGAGKYKKVKKTGAGEVVTIYKNVGAKKIILTSYKKYKKL